MVGGPVRKSPALLHAHLKSLDAQILPPRVTLTPCFVDDNTDPASSQMLQEYCEGHKGLYLDGRAPDTPHFDDQHPLTHQWSGDAMVRVGQIKDTIIHEAVAGAYDALWLVDSDLLCGPRTLWSLWYADAPVACAVFWTRWQPEAPPLPQVWLRHPYQLDGRGIEQPEFLHSLATRQRTQVWGQGACTLYRTSVFQKGLSFDRVPDLPTDGMWQGEDRHLCTRAERLHIPMVADAWPDIFHCYAPKDQARVDEMWIRLMDEVPGHPKTDDLVSLHLRAVEPIAVAGGQMMGQLQHVRGRLGRLSLADELEAAVRGMERGERRIVSVTYPHWSKSMFRGTKRLIEVRLVDWRPHGYAPGLA